MPINVGQAVGYLDLDTSKFTKGLQGAYKELEVFKDKTATATDKWTAVGKAMTSAGTTLTKNVTVPLVAIGAASLKAGIDFESAFAGVRKTVDATEEQFTTLRQGILDMSGKMPQSATQIAAVAEAAGQLGIKTEDILNFTEVMVKLGDSTNLSSDVAATSLARLANITGMAADDYERLGSTIVALGNNLATTESEIVDMAMNIAAAGTQVGMTEDEILAVSGALSSLGIEAAMGGTAFSKTLREMQIAVETGGPALNDFANVANMSMEEFQKAFKEDASAAIQSFLVGLTDTERLGGTTIKILKDLGVEETKMNDVLTRLANGNKLVNDSFVLANKAWKENTALTKEAEQRYETTASQLKILWNELTRVGIELAEQLLPAFKSLVQWLKDVVKWFSNLNDGTKEFIVKFGLLLAAIGPIITILGKLITTVISVSGAIKGCAAAMAILKGTAALLSGPVGLVTLGLGALAVATVLVTDKTFGMSKSQKELYDSMEKSKKEYEETTKNIREQQMAITDNAYQANRLVEKMYEISESNRSAKDKTILLNQMLEELKLLIPDVVLEIDEETGTIKTQKSEVDKLISSYLKLAVAKAYSEEMTAESKRYADALKSQNEAMNKSKPIIEQRQQLWKKETELKEKLSKLDPFKDMYEYKVTKNQLADTQHNIKNLTWEFNKYSDAITENNNILTDSDKKIKEYEKRQNELNKTVENSINTQVEGSGKVINADNNETKVKAENTKTKTQLINEISDLQEKGYTDAAKNIKDLNKEITDDDISSAKVRRQNAKQAAKEKEQEADKELKAEKTRYDKLVDLNEKYTDDIKKINEDYQRDKKKIDDDERDRTEKLDEEYKNSINSRAEALRSSLGVFDEFEKNEDISGRQLIKNLESQLKGIRGWREDVEKLMERGVTGSLLDEIRELGPKYAGEIDEMTKLSDKELEKLIGLWDDIGSETLDIAKKEGEDPAGKLKTEYDKAIDTIKADTKTKMDELNSETNTELGKLLVTYQDNLRDLGVTVSPVAEESGIQIIKAIELGVDETKEDLMTKLNNLKTNVAEIVREIKSSVRSAEFAADSIDGSHAGGLDYVPKDGYVAQLHKGERVLTAQENKEYSGAKVITTGKQTLNVNFTGTMGQLIRVLKPEISLDDDRGGVAY